MASPCSSQRSLIVLLSTQRYFGYNTALVKFGIIRDCDFFQALFICLKVLDLGFDWPNDVDFHQIAMD